MALTGCDRDAVESWLKPASADDKGSLFVGENLTAAIESLKQKTGEPISALSLLVYRDHAVLQAQSRDDRANVEQYVYRQGLVSGPERVKLLGKGKLDDNLFPLGAARLEGVSILVADATEKANIPEGKVTRVLLKRNLPESMDIQFQVFVTNQRRDTIVNADKDGKVIAQ